MANKTELDQKAEEYLKAKDLWSLYGQLKMGACEKKFLRPLIFQACFAGDFSLASILFIESPRKFPIQAANILAEKCKRDKNPYGLYSAIAYGAKDYLVDLINLSEEKGGRFLWFADWAREEISRNNI